MFAHPLTKKTNLKFVVAISLFYFVLSFAYSFIGFLARTPGNQYYEYSPTRLLVEIGGHLLFGFLAAIPFLDVEIILLTAAFSIVIDADHILSALKLDVAGRPDHSILFAIVATLLLIYTSRKARLDEGRRLKLAFVVAVSMLAHFAYDVFAGNGSVFQFLIPFNFKEFEIAYGGWLNFELAGFFVALLATFLALTRTRHSIVEAQSIKG